MSWVKNFWSGLLRWLGTPFRAISNSFQFLVDLTQQQLKSVLTLAMIGGMVALTGVNIWYTYRAEAAINKGHEYHNFFELLQEQLRFNSGLIGWFALIMGLIVFGADYFRAKWGNKEFGAGKGSEPVAPVAAPAPTVPQQPPVPAVPPNPDLFPESRPE